MAWNLRLNKRITIIPGIRVNLSKSGLSISLGTKGAWFTIGKDSHRTTLGLPGTGVSMTKQEKGGLGLMPLLVVLGVLVGIFLITHLGAR
jgi:hypothetical protein